MKNNYVKQKKHNRAIDITDIAISKVPRTKLFGFNDSQNAFIQDQHKELLSKAKRLCREKASSEMEVVILIDIIEWETWTIEGIEPRKVKITDNPEAFQKVETARKNTLLLMHNHPSTGTFSADDLKLFCNNESLYIMTVVGNDGSIYILTKNNDFVSDQTLSKYGKLTVKYKKYKNNATLAMRELLKNSKEYGLSYKHGRKQL